MRRYRLLLASVAGAVVSCQSTPVATPALLPAERAALADTLRAATREYGAIQKPGLCADLTPFTKRFAYPDSQYLSVHDTVAHFITRAEWEATLHNAFCGLRQLDGKVDTVAVQVLTRDIAMVGWTFDEIATDTTGKASHIKGSVLQSWIRTPAGWAVTGDMAAHVVVPR